MPANIARHRVRRTAETIAQHLELSSWRPPITAEISLGQPLIGIGGIDWAGSRRRRRLRFGKAAVVGLAFSESGGARKPGRSLHVVDQVARPIFVLARARPIVRMNRLILCLLAGEDVLDRGPDRRASAVGTGDIDRHRPATRLLAVDVAREHPILQQRLVLLAAVAGIRPDPSRRIARIEQLAEPRPGMRRGIGHGPAPDQPVASIGTDMVLVAERRDRDVDRLATRRPGRAWPWCTSPSSGVGHCRPILLAELGRLLRPAVRDAPLLSACFSALLLRCLGAATMVASTSWPDMAR